MSKAAPKKTILWHFSFFLALILIHSFKGVMQWTSNYPQAIGGQRTFIKP
jgi:hypothetical protein